MLTRIQPSAVIGLARRDLPRPVDVINLISTSNFERYRWYAVLVMAPLMAVGAKVLWMGRIERSIAGEPQAEKLLIVRYPSHRRFLAMTLNPYYLAINRLREAGVSRFEASFTKASHEDPGLARRTLLAGVHINSPADGDALAAVSGLVEGAGGELVYATRAVASLGILDPPEVTDPNPLTYGELALFAIGEGDLAGLDALAGRLEAVTAGCSLQAYRREPKRHYRPTLRPATGPAGAAAG
jgi:uncharacterized protein (DUF1330 family)